MDQRTPHVAEIFAQQRASKRFHRVRRLDAGMKAAFGDGSHHQSRPGFQFLEISIPEDDDRSVVAISYPSAFSEGQRSRGFIPHFDRMLVAVAGFLPMTAASILIV